MATLVLTAVGTALGGPIGGALGAVLGQGIDARLLAPKGRAGSRLSDLRLQGSSYGTALPKLFGTMRVAGTVIWATDLVEHRERDGGGKGKPATTSYAYTASFAVALSARSIRAVHRVWADGKLLRGGGGDWKSATGFRLHLGDEAQAPDPLIAAAEGIGETPAYRGLAYAVFEDLELGDYGNRIPALTFEVEADAGPVPLGVIVADASGGAVAGTTCAAVSGYAVSEDSVRGLLETLAQVYPVRVDQSPGGLRITDVAPPAEAIPAADLGSSLDQNAQPRIELERDGGGDAPELLTLGYFDPARDYQAGSQRARRAAPARRSVAIDLPAALEADAAKAVAEAALVRAGAERRRATVRLPWRRLDIAPGALVTLPGLAGGWRVDEVTLERMAVELKLVAAANASAAPSAATPGRAVREPDALAGATVLQLLDLPPLSDTPADTLAVWAAAAGTGSGWRRAPLLLSSGDGASWNAAGSTAAPAVIGTALTALADASAALVDGRSALEVELLHEAMTLLGRDEDALAGGANLAMVGDELVQFASATQIGPKRWRLGGLWRGRRGTEAAIAAHAAGERFVLVEEASLVRLELPLVTLGGTVRVVASGIGDGTAGAAASIVAGGRALRPPAPVGLRAFRAPDGAIRINWTRRSRVGWAWLDGRDVPLGEAAERYRVTLTPSTGAAHTIECGIPSCDYDVAMQAADASVGAAGFRIEVRQLGDIAASEAATLLFPS